MQWSDAIYGGFSNSNPWRNLNNNYLEYNVEKMQKDKNSLWSHYSKFIKLRTKNKVISQGKVKMLESNNTDIFAYIKSFENSNMLIIHNFSSLDKKSFSININNSVLSAGNYNFKEILDIGFKDRPSDTLSSNYCYYINNKVNDIIIKPYSYSCLNSGDIMYIDIFKE